MKIRKTSVLFLATALLLAGVAPVSAESPAEAGPGGEFSLAEIVAAKYPENGYAAYRRRHADLPRIDDPVRIRVENPETLEPGGEVTLRGDIPQTGLYALTVEYRYTDTRSVRNADLRLKIDGETPFYEAGESELPRLWAQSSVSHREGANDLLPESVQVSEPAALALSDPAGYFGVYLFRLEKGIRTFAFSSEIGGFEIRSVTLGCEKAESYRVLAAGRAAKPAGETVTVQGEDLFRKNASSVSAGFDRSDPSVVPSDPVYKKLNVLDGARFNRNGQKAVWKFEIEKGGLYKIGIKFKQDTLQGLSVTRTVRIDGELPCEELQEVSFPYGEKWQYRVLSADGEALFVELEPGKHELSLEVTLGPVAEYVRRIDEAVFALNYLYRKILMVTGPSPDPFRDYNLQNEIPYLIPAFRALTAELKSLYAGWSQSVGGTGGQISVIGRMIDQLESFVRNPYDIQDRLSAYRTNIGSLSSLISSVTEQPLSVDYISLIGFEEGDTASKSGFWQNLRYVLEGILGSFACDYSTVGEAAKGSESIRVWYGGGREQAELLKSIIDSGFTPNEKISVNLQLVVMPLAQAVLAGTAPDVALTASRTQPVNFGARGVAEDLSRFDGFDEIRKTFGENLLRPYTYKNGVYAIPVTLDHFMMFYREDILKELGVRPPETWEEFDALVPILQRENMAVGLPYTAMSSQATVESGLGAKDIFATLLLQNDVALYNADLTRIDLGSDGAVAVFKRWTDYYNLYQFDLQYDFFNRFRTGEMPLAVQGIGAYNLLSAAAPEIRGLWKMTAIPGTRRADGSINRATAASGSGTVMLSTSRNKDAAWRFIRWWVGAEAQARFGNELEIRFGPASRHNPAHPDAVPLLPWRADELKALTEQRAAVLELPEALGGYYVARGLDNAFRGAVMSGKNYREVLRTQEISVNAEFARKQAEFQ